MHKKTISLALCLAMIVSMLAVGFTTTNAATVDSAAAGVSKIESADDFTWDNANVYFLLTDRFYNGDTSNDHSYGRALDANGNPLSGYVDSGNDHFAHYSYHGYYVLDYTETDANFGTKQEFKTMVDTAHSHGIRVVMDIVMNHAGYNNILDMEEYNYGTLKSGYQQYKYQLTNAGAFHSYIDYESSATDWGRWWGSGWVRSGLPGYTDDNAGDEKSCLEGLPDFRTESTATVSIPTFLQTKWGKEGSLQQKLYKYGSSGTVSDYLTTWLAEWVENYGVDGFRCDTAKHVEKASWKKLKTKCVQALKTWRQNNPTAVGADWDEDFWMTGECWGYQSGYGSYYTDGGFDSMISFKVTGAVSSNPSGMPGVDSINGMYSSYAADINSNPNYNLLTYISSHDTGLARQNPYWQGTALQLLPGGVQIFYGDETSRPLVSGLTVDGAGHAVRSDMNWSTIDQGVLTHWQKVGTFRKNHVAVGAGSHQQISAYNSSTGYTFSRTYSDDNVNDSVVCCIGAPTNQNIAVDVSSVFTDGKTVTNEYDGTTAVVTNGKATFNSGSQGVILISGPQSTISMSLTGGRYSFLDRQTVTVSLRGADYAMVSVAGGTPFRVVDGQSFEIGEGIAEGQEFTVEMTASNGEETVSKSFSYKKKDPNAVTTIYFDNSAYNWQKVNIYVYDDSVTPVVNNAKWPGEPMELDSQTGYYAYEVDEDLANSGAVVFNNGSAQYPAEGVRLDINGTDMILRGTTWEVFGGGDPTQPTTPTTPTEPTTPVGDKVLIGDANLDGRVNVQDVTAIQRHQAELSFLTGNSLVSADVNQDGSITIKDATLIQLYLIDMTVTGSHAGEYKEVGQQPTNPTTPTQPTQPTQPTTPPSGGVTLNPGPCNVGDEVWYAWTWGSGEGRWVKGSASGSNYIFSDVDSNIIFVRMSSDNANWDNVWNKTNDLTTQIGGTYTLTGWSGALMNGNW